MSHAETLPLAAPGLTAVLFGLSGCLVDFGARARQQTIALPEHAEATPGALDSLHNLQRQQIPCAWLDELPLRSPNRCRPYSRRQSNLRNIRQQSIRGLRRTPAGKP